MTYSDLQKRVLKLFPPILFSFLVIFLGSVSSIFAAPVREKKWSLYLARFLITPIFFVILFLNSHSSVYAAIYCNNASYLNNCYVDGNDGSDTLNDGKTPTTAWKTIQQAANTVNAGDIVNVRGEIIYSGSNSCIFESSTAVVCTTKSGAPGNYITYQAWTGTGIPIIDATSSQYGFSNNYDKAYLKLGGFIIKNAAFANVQIGSNSLVFNNTITNGARYGIEIGDSSADNLYIQNNTLVSNLFASINLGGGAPINRVVKNNIIVNGGMGLVSNGSFSVPHDNNLFYGNTGYPDHPEFGTDYSVSNNISASLTEIHSDPLFVDSTSGNFSLTTSSPAKNAGADLLGSGVTADILGVSRPQGANYDIGAYEYYDIPVSLTALSPDPGTNTKPTFTGTASTIGAASISSVSYSIDSGSWTTSGVTGTTSFTIAIPSDLSDGLHNIRVRATDTYGNSSDSSLYGTDSFTIDTTGPLTPTINYPSGYSNDSTKPTLSFNKSTDITSGMSSYSVSLDSGKSKSYSTSGIPTSGTGVWKDDSEVKVEFSGDSEIKVYFKGLDKTDLTEGKHSWTVTAYDQVGNSISKSSEFSLDRSSPSLSELALANVSTISNNGEYKLEITNRMPSFSGKVIDSYQGSEKTNDNGTKDTFEKISSGPDIVTLTLNKFNEKNNTYTVYATKDVKQTDIKDTGSEKYTRFYVQTPFPLTDGYYQVLLTAIDTASNTNNQTTLYLNLNYHGKIPTTSFQNTVKITKPNSVIKTISDIVNTVKETVTQKVEEVKKMIPSPTTEQSKPQVNSFNIFNSLKNFFSKIFHL